MSDHTPTPSTAYRALLANLIRTREERGLTPEQLAEQIGLSAEQIQAYEAGEKQLGLHDARLWLIALDLPFIHLRDGVEVKDAVNDNDEPAADPNPTINMSESTQPALPPSNSEPDEPPIQVLYFVPNLPPEVRKIPNTLDAMQELVDGYISPFRTGIPGTVGVANDEGIVHGMEFNRVIPATGAQIFGPFFVAGDTPDFRSLTPLELEQALDALALELSQSEFRDIMLTHDEGKLWVENWE